MSWDVVKGNWKEMKGRLKEKWGKLTDSDLDQIDGQRDQLSGSLQRYYGIAKQEAEQKIDEFVQHMKSKDTQEARDVRRDD
ncbi:MAG: CsbD family protein [Bdellovibrionota bacterium]